MIGKGNRLLYKKYLFSKLLETLLNTIKGML